MTKEIIQIADYKNCDGILSIGDALRQDGYEVRFLGDFDPNHIVLLVLHRGDTPEDLFSAYPWLKEQHDFSSIKGLRIMPFIAYHGHEESIDEIWEDAVGETYEEVFSGEFKPYGWDLDENGLEEFHRVLEEYL